MDTLTAGALQSPFNWISAPECNEGNENLRKSMCDLEDRLEAIHPIFVITWQAVEEAHAFFGSQVGFKS